MTTPLVQRNDFVYQDTLFVDLGPGKHHIRASASDLKELLLLKSTAPLKDQVAHYYEAQHIHYGLQRTKDKNAAKVRLTNALAGGKLKIPADLVKMEGDMKKEWTSALKKAKTGGLEKAEPKIKKKKADESGATKMATNIALKVSKDGTIKFNFKGGPAAKATPTKKPKTETKKAIPDYKVTKKSATAPKAKAVTGKAPTAKVDPSKAGRSAVPISTTKTAKVPKQTAKRSMPSASTSTRPTPQQNSQQACDDNDGYDGYDDYGDDLPPPYDAMDYEMQDRHRSPSANDDEFPIAGSYSLDISVLSLHGESFNTLTVAFDPESGALWGRFYIGPKHGLIQMQDTTGLSNGESKMFGWRSKDENSEKLKFGTGCNGRMRFDGKGGISGVFDGGLMYGENVNFEGTLEDDGTFDVLEADMEWDGYPIVAYGAPGY